MFRNGLIVGKFAPFHAGHRHLIDTALAESRHVTLMVYSRPDFAHMPQAVRAGWIRATHPTVEVLEPDDPPPDAADDDTHRRYVRDNLARRGIEVDAVFTSEGYGDGFAAMMGAEHRLVDRARSAVPVSVVAIRENPTAHASFLEARVLDHLRQQPLGRLDERLPDG